MEQNVYYNDWIEQTKQINSTIKHVFNMKRNERLKTIFQILVAGTGLFILKNTCKSIGSLFGYVTDYIKNKMICSITCTNYGIDESYDIISHWLARPEFQNKLKQIKIEPIKRTKDTNKYICLPCFTTYWIWYDKTLFLFENNTAFSSDGNSKNHSMTIKCLSDKKLLALFDTAREYFENKEHDEGVECFNAYHDRWELHSRQKRRDLDTVYIPEQTKNDIVVSIDNFINRDMKFYDDNCIPYQKGFLLYGKPGCGKTSFIKAMASKFNLPICFLDINNVRTSDLSYLFQSLPEKIRIVVLEDVDSCTTPVGGSSNTGSNNRSTSDITISELLNILDGMFSKRGTIIFLTTNHIERLDEALIRPGRVDKKVEFKNITEDDMTAMFSRFYPEHKQYASEIAKQIGSENICHAEFQAFCIENKTDPSKAINNIKDYLDYVKHHKELSNQKKKQIQNIDDHPIATRAPR